MKHAGAKEAAQLVRLLLVQANLLGKGDQQGLGAVIVAAVGLGAQVLDFFHTGHIGVPPQVN